MLLAVAGLVILADQASKLAVVHWLGPDATNHRVEILGRALAFQYLENTGAAFGVLDRQGTFLTVLAGVVVAALLGYYLRSGRTSVLLALSLGLVSGGALGNVIDRVRLGYVVDFVAVGIWPKFNVADSAVTVGVVLLAWVLMREPELTNERPENAVQPERGPTGDGRWSEMRKVALREGGCSYDGRA